MASWRFYAGLHHCFDLFCCRQGFFGCLGTSTRFEKGERRFDFRNANATRCRDRLHRTTPLLALAFDVGHVARRDLGALLRERLGNFCRLGFGMLFPVIEPKLNNRVKLGIFWKSMDLSNTSVFILRGASPFLVDIPA